MKLACVVVFYNETKDEVENLIRYLEFVDKLYVFDNSEKINDDYVSLIHNMDKTEYISFNSNMGIAYALKYCTDKAINEKFDYILTMDQDSIFPNDYFSTIKKILASYLDENVGIISLNNSKNLTIYSENLKPSLIESRQIITSGSFINLKKYKEIDGFNKDLFIDSVDFDLNRQFIEKGIKIYQIENICIKHKVGNPKKRKFLFFNIYSYNHSPIRYYYLFRNVFYLYKHHKKYFLKKYLRVHWTYLKMLYVDDNRKEKKRFIKLGIKDAKKNIMGKYNHN